MQKTLILLVFYSILHQVTATTLISVTDIPTPGLPGYVTYTLTAESDAGDISGFDFVGNGSNFGFFGPMKQRSTNTKPTVFASELNPGFFILIDPKQDSHFTFAAGDVFGVGASESSNSLQAAFQFEQPIQIDGPLIFAQVVIPINQTVTFAGQSIVFNGTTNILDEVSGILGVPEPTSAVLFSIALICSSAGRRHFMVS